MVDSRDTAWRNRAPRPHAHRNTARQAVDGLWTEVCGQQKQSNDPGNNQHILNTPNTGLRERGNDTSKSTGRSGRQKAATRRNMRREERVTVQGPVKEQQPDGMSHRGKAGWSLLTCNPHPKYLAKIPCPAIPCPALPTPAMPWHAMPCPAMLRHAMHHIPPVPPPPDATYPHDAFRIPCTPRPTHPMPCTAHMQYRACRRKFR